MRIGLTRLRAVLLLTMIVLPVSAASAEETSDHDRVLSAAQAAYDRGLVLEPVDQAAAQAAFSESADGWRRVIESGIFNGQLWTNLGNAELHAGRNGEAIAAYLEADRLMPGNARVRANQPLPLALPSPVC